MRMTLTSLAAVTCDRHLRPSLATVTSPAAVSCGRHLRPSPRLSWPMRRRPMRSRAAMLCAITFGLALNMLLMGCMLHLRRFASLAVFAAHESTDEGIGVSALECFAGLFAAAIHDYAPWYGITVTVGYSSSCWPPVACAPRNVSCLAVACIRTRRQCVVEFDPRPVPAGVHTID